MKPLIPVLLLTLMSGCSTSQQQMLPVNPDTTMLKLWQRQSGGAQRLMDSRATLRRGPEQASRLTTNQHSYTRDAASEVRQQFPRLPNPDMVLYVFPHLASGTSPVPGYSTVFPFYTRTQYALPGERLAPL